MYRAALGLYNNKDLILQSNDAFQNRSTGPKDYELNIHCKVQKTQQGCKKAGQNPA